MGWNILGNTNQKFYNNYKGPIVVWKKRVFTAPRDYFFPINAEEILISGVKQNMGW
jgi:allophanate hydrolase subunit 1